jgi:glycosyltransferase involved in cell wall biosynthesis
MRFHLLALAHTQTTRAFSVCAFTSLARQKADMMTDLGHEVVLYASEDNDAKCSEHVVCIKKSEQARLCGIEKPTDVLRASWEPTSPHWAVFSARIIDALEARLQPEDIILVSAGWSLSPVIERFQQHTRVEYAVGYTGWHEQTHRVLPSYAWQHTLMGKWYGSHGTRGRFSDRVIPHWVDPAEFPEPKTKAGGDYLLFVGRLNEDKGVQIAIDTAKTLSVPLVVAGQGPHPLPDWVNRTGVVGPEHRAQLMVGAAAVFAPSLYLEPFGLVAVEAQMAGTPVITTDWGAYPETVEDGVTGVRCRSSAEFVAAARKTLNGQFDPKTIRERALARFSIGVIGPRYEQFYKDVAGNQAPTFLPG